MIRKPKYDRVLPILLLIAVAGCSQPKPSTATGATTTAEGKTEELTLKASDGKEIFARLYHVSEPAKGVVLMFHQARSNMEEYTPIAPEVTKLGYDCLTIDQRSGGDMWGATNRTAAQYPAKPTPNASASDAQGFNVYDDVADYKSAYPDLEGALQWAESKAYKKIVAWGSSYSACLVFRLAAENPKSIAAVLAFSPFEFPNEDTVASWNKKVQAPVLVALAKKEALANGRRLYEAYGPYPARKKDVLVTNETGIHGSSTLRKDKNPSSSDYYWAAVKKFFGKIEEK